jgi:hypothetical protein
MFSLQLKIDRRLRARCKQLGISASLLEDVLRAPDARQLIADRRFQARRRVQGGRTLVVRYVETWKARKRCWTVIHAGYGGEDVPYGPGRHEPGGGSLAS